MYIDAADVFLFHRKFLPMKQNAWQDRTAADREDTAGGVLQHLLFLDNG